MDVSVIIAPYFGVYVFIFGLLIGSFLNVVIYRLPIMLNILWQEQAREILGLPAVEDKKRFNLAYPASHCPSCQVKVHFCENIPIISYILQRGKCRYCQCKVSIQYPLVEFITALVFFVLYYKFGLSYTFLGGMILASFLIVLTCIDLNTQLLPDIVTLPLLWLGLLFNLFSDYTGGSLASAVLGAIVGYLFLWVVFKLFLWITGKEGIGYGDFKLFSALGAWLGLLGVPILLLFSSISGLVLAILLRVKRNQAMPFGPAIAISGLILFIFYPEILALFNF